MTDILQDPRVAALLVAIDTDEHATFKDWIEAIQEARAAFALPVEMEYTIPSWDNALSKINNITTSRGIRMTFQVEGQDSLILDNAQWNALREATKRSKPKHEKLEQEFWVNYYADGIGSIWNTKKEAEKACDVDGKTLRVREVLE